MLYDVVLIQVEHRLLGRPWQYAMDVNHDGGKNQNTLHLNGLTHFLTPLSRREVYENQLKIKKAYDEFVGREENMDNPHI